MRPEYFTKTSRSVYLSACGLSGCLSLSLSLSLSRPTVCVYLVQTLGKMRLCRMHTQTHGCAWILTCMYIFANPCFALPWLARLAVLLSICRFFHVIETHAGRLYVVFLRTASLVFYIHAPLSSAPLVLRSADLPSRDNVLLSCAMEHAG